MIRSILVTGGTGTFGQAFVQSALKRGVERVCVFSRGEHRQAQMRALIPDSRVRWFIGDVRDRDRLRRAMQGTDLVVHAAALKRIEVGHYNPIEMIRTNVDGAVNVIEAAQDAGMGIDPLHAGRILDAPRKIIALSSDKAYQPVSAYGYSKAIAESLFLSANDTVGAHGPRFACVRYGNVWRSAGSVVPTWESMQGPVPVTDPECTRFFMRLEEAVNLVWDTAQTMRGGELVIPEWLPAYRLGDLAEAMGRDIKVLGLPAHEKRHEGMRDGLTSDRARRMSIEELRLELYGADSRQLLVNRTIDELELTVRSRNALENAGIHTLLDLVQMTEHEFSLLPYIGKANVDSTGQELQRHGLRFGMKP